MDLSDFPSLEQLVPLMPGHVYLLDRHGVYRGCNDLQAEDLGLNNRNEIIGKTNKTLSTFQLYPDLIETLDLNNNKVIQSGVPSEFEEQAPFPDGLVRSFKSFKMPIFNKNKEVIGLLGMSFDISKRQSEFTQLQNKHDQAELALDNIMANLPGHVYWVDKNNCFLGCNDDQAHDVGLKSRADIIGMSVASFQTPDNAKRIIENNKQVILHGRTIEEEENFVNSAGKEQTYLSKKVPLIDKKDNILGLLGISFDITELKNFQKAETQAISREAAEAKVKAQTQEEIQKAILTFTATMSHDLRTPLSTISLVDSLLLKTLPALTQVYNEFKSSHPDLDQDDPRYIHTKYLRLVLDSYKSIAEALKQAESYIEATLKIIRGAASGSELISKEDLVACSIEEILRRAIYTYPYKDEVDQAKVHLDTMDAFEFMGNSIFMARIVQNLIKNAFEQIHLKGKGEIFVTCEAGDPLNYLYIKDTAGGVSETILAQLFNGFNSTKRGGTGIGLSSAKQIMQAFGGDINCRLVDGDCIELVLCFPRLQQ